MYNVRDAFGITFLLNNTQTKPSIMKHKWTKVFLNYL